MSWRLTMEQIYLERTFPFSLDFSSLGYFLVCQYDWVLSFKNCSDSVFISSKPSAYQFSFSNSLYITAFQISTQWVSVDSQRTSCVLNIVSKSSSKPLMLIECRSNMQIFCVKELLKFSINAHLVTYQAHISSSSSFVV